MSSGSSRVVPDALRARTTELAARTASATPHVRKISMVRVLSPEARGWIEVLWWRSTTSTRAP